MPIQSQAQRRFLHAVHPEFADEWEQHTAKNKPLPERKHQEKSVKRAYDAGVTDALVRFGLKLAGEEIRLQIPRREFHGWDAAWRNGTGKGEKKAGGEPEDAAPVPLEPQADPNSPVERLTALLQRIETPNGPRTENATKERLERDVLWGAPSNLAGGDAANRQSDMGQPTGFGGVF